MSQPSAVELELLLGCNPIDIVKLRSLARQGLPNTQFRVRVWPLLLGLSKADLEEDKKILETFTQTHTQGLNMMTEHNDAKTAWVAVKRAYDQRKEQALAQYKLEQEHQVDDTASETTIGPEDDEQARPTIVSPSSATPPTFIFSEPSPDTPPVPNYPTSYWDQISKDIERSLWKQIVDNDERNLKRIQLHRLICAVICTVRDDENRPLHYFQGYHDIASVLLLACGEQLAFSLLKQLSKTYLRDQMMEKIDYVTSLLQILWPLVNSIDSQIGRFLTKSQVQPYAALPWVMTWFSHVLEDQPLSERLFDLFLASPTWMPLYLAASLVVYMSHHGLYSCPCEFSEVHNFVSRFCSRTALPWEVLIRDALKFYAVFPPSSIGAQSKLPSDSYLLRYPYYWVPKNEIVAKVPLLQNKQFLLALTAVGVAAVSAVAAIGFMYTSQAPH